MITKKGEEGDGSSKKHASLHAEVNGSILVNPYPKRGSERWRILGWVIQLGSPNAVARTLEDASLHHLKRPADYLAKERRDNPVKFFARANVRKRFREMPADEQSVILRDLSENLSMKNFSPVWEQLAFPGNRGR